MLTPKEIQDKLKDRTLTKIRDHLEISYPTLLKIAKGKFDNVTYSAVKKVSDYLEANP